MIPTFVFVHGASSNSFGWASLQRELTLLGHRTLAVDLPGHGFEAAFSGLPGADVGLDLRRRRGTEPDQGGLRTARGRF